MSQRIKYWAPGQYLAWEHTTANDPSGIEMIDLAQVPAVGWQPRTIANEPYWYVVVGGERRRFPSETDADAYEAFEVLLMRWMGLDPHVSIANSWDSP